MYDIFIYHDNKFGSCPKEYVIPHLEWCENNINNIWRAIPPHEIVIHDGTGVELILSYIFQFEDEDDAMAFKLRWL